MKIYALSAAQMTAIPASADRALGWALSTVLSLSNKGEAIVEVVDTTEGFISAGYDNIGGDNDDLNLIEPITSPFAVKGALAVAVDTSLAVADAELETYEFIKFVDGATNRYLFWGSVKASKTDFYTPAMDALVHQYLLNQDSNSNF